MKLKTSLCGSIAALALTAGMGYAEGKVTVITSFPDSMTGPIEKAFEAANPGITVTLEVQSWENINDVIRTKVQSNQAPDILNIDSFAGYVEDDLL